MPVQGILQKCPVRPKRVVTIQLVLLAVALSLVGIAGQPVLAGSYGALSITAGDVQSCSIEAVGTYCWGDNDFGELGNGTTTQANVPVPVDTSGLPAGQTFTQIAGGSLQYTCALDSAGAAYCWGENYYGNLGDGTTADSSVPEAVNTSGVLAGKTLTAITVGKEHACALDSTGRAYCWGYNGFGELGDGTTIDSSVPLAVDSGGALAGKTLTQIAAGGEHTCALDTQGTVYCWGYNGYGQLGDGATVDSEVPVAVDTGGVLAGKRLTQITASGLYHTCALDSAGLAYCWGYNDFGQLGDGTTTDSDVPVAVDTDGVLAGASLTHITAGASHTCAVSSSGGAYCWGRNTSGGLGDGTTDDSNVPVAVDDSGALAGKILAQISAGGDHTCAVDTDGADYCWGDNTHGDLGNDSTTDSSVPVLAGPQAPANVTAVPGDTTVTVSWSAPGSVDGGTVTGYTATASPGGESCTVGDQTTCTISGLTSGTTYSVTVVAHTTVGDSGESAAVSVTPGSGLAFTSDSSDSVAYGVSFSFAVTAIGSPSPTITKTGSLPAGVHFTGGKQGTATITGTPGGSAAGDYLLTLRAKNQSGTVTQTFTLTVIRDPAIRRIPSTTATVGSPLNIAITATGYPPPTLTESGALPAGLSFSSNANGTASITGTPTPGSGGNYPIKVTATNASGVVNRVFTLAVHQTPAITSPNSASAATGSAFFFQVTATGYPMPKITESGPLPRGVRFKSLAGTLSGTPKPGSGGSYSLIITAKNAAGVTTQNFTFVVT